MDPLSLAKAVPIVPRYSAGTAAEYAPDVVHTGYTVGGRFWSVDDRPLLGNCDGENFDYTEVRFKVEKHAMRICRIKRITEKEQPLLIAAAVFVGLCIFLAQHGKAQVNNAA